MRERASERFPIVSTDCATSLHHEHELIPHETYMRSGQINNNNKKQQQQHDVRDDDNDDDGDDTDDDEDANALWVE